MRNVMMKMMMMISCVALLMMKMMISYFSLLMAPVADEILLRPYIFVFYTTPLRVFAACMFPAFRSKIWLRTAGSSGVFRFRAPMRVTLCEDVNMNIQ